MNMNSVKYQSFTLRRLLHRFSKSPKTDLPTPEPISKIPKATVAASQYPHHQFLAYNRGPNLEAAIHRRYGHQDTVKSFFKLPN